MSHPRSTARIRFSEWQASDLSAAQLLWGDRRVTHYISRTGYSKKAIDERLALEVTSQAADGVQYWPMFANSGELIGVCGLHRRGKSIYELGYHLRQAFWGAGLATEAALAVVSYARTQLHAQALVACHHPQNLASQHLLVDKLGFAYTHDEVYAVTGLVTPHYLLPLTHPQPTGRLRFGNWLPGQQLQAQALWGDPAVTHFISTAGFTQKQIADRLAFECASQAEHGVQYWPLTTKDGAFVGVCGLHHQRHGRFELGYHLLPVFWHLGLATEAAQGVIKFAQQTLQSQTLVAGHHPDNQASKQVLQKLGFYHTYDRFYAPIDRREPNYQLDL